MNLILAILGIGFLIFIHELGHFLAAKFVGVRVHTFAVGFQPTIFGWRARLLAFTYGETEYVIGLVPLGGYVKMAGEDPGEERTDSEDEFHRKPIPSRLLILVAGAAMNLISGLALFALAFTMGVKQMAPVVGGTDPGGPAWHAGIRTGDKITTVNGEPWSDYSNIATAIALAGGSQPVSLGLERSEGANGSETRSLEVAVQPEWNTADGRYRIGIYPSISNSISSVVEGSPSQLAGLQEGDQIQSIRLNVPEDGLVLKIPSDLPADLLVRSLSRIRQSTASGVLDIEAIRDGSPFNASIPLEPPPVDSAARTSLGILARARTIVAAREPASSVFQSGDEIISLQISGENPVNVEVFDLYTIEKAAQLRDVSITCRLLDGTSREIAANDLRRWILEDILVGDSQRWVTNVSEDAKTIGLTEGCQILSIENRFNGLDEYLDDIIPAGTLVKWVTATTPRTLQSIRLPEDMKLGLVTRSLPIIGRTLAGSPARLAQIPSGSVVHGINEINVEDWTQIQSAIPAAEGEITISVSDEYSENKSDILVTPLPLMTSLGLQMSALQFREELPFGQAISAGIDQSWIWGGRIFLTLRALFAGDVHGKNLNGPVGIIDLGRKVSSVGFGNLLFLLALISINLGIFNLLPFPILDGGHILFLAIEGIRGKPVPDQIQNYVHLVAFLMLISMALFVTYNDILRLG